MIKENKKSKNKLDKVSILMISIFTVLIVGAAVVLFAMSADNENEPNVTEPKMTEAETDFDEADKTVTYDNYNDFADAFVEACREGDTQTMRSLYYKDLFDIPLENSNLSEEEYFDVMRDNMLHIVDFEEFPYGGSDLLEIRLPIDYINELYFRKNGTNFPYVDLNVEDCVCFRAYFENGVYLDFMFAQIDGLWYVVV